MIGNAIYGVTPYGDTNEITSLLSPENRGLSATMVAALYGQETGEAFLVLLTIEHSSLASPIRVTSDSVNTVSNGNTFVPFPFEILLPNDPEDAVPTSRLRICNVSREITVALRTIPDAPTVKIQLVLASSPDTIEVEYSQFTLKSATYDASIVEGTLSGEDFLVEPYPSGSMNPEEFPGLFEK